MSAASAAGIHALNEALRAELRLIDVYSEGEESNLPDREVRDLVATYLARHVQHVQVLCDAVRDLGGTPVSLAHGDRGHEILNDEEDMLKLAARLEQGAVGALLKALALLPCRCHAAAAAAALLGEEATHCAVLRQALGERPVFMA
jgi:bacterioferritin (cytochrome b1)